MTAAASKAARSAILGRIRKSLGVDAADAARAGEAARRVAEPVSRLIPERALKSGDELVAQFRSFLEGQTATVIETADPSLVPEAVATYLRDTNQPATLRLGSDARLTGMPWRETGLTILQGAADSADTAGLSHAVAGIAETGTLIIATGADNPVTLAFLPETHVIVVDRSTIVGSYEDALIRVREAFGQRGMPRTLNYISGPSRTADIGGRIVIGAHGPRRLCVVISGTGTVREA